MFALKSDFKKILLGGIFCLVIFLVTTLPFANTNVFQFGWKIFKERYPLPIGIDGKASISAFNFQTIFFRIDIDYSHEKIAGITSGTWGFISYIVTNLIAISIFKNQKNKLFAMLSGLFIVGMGNFLFMATMLERYFFPGFSAMIVLSIVRPKMLWNLFLINLILAANITYSFFRRESDEIARPFITNNFLLIRMLSLVQVAAYFYFVRHLIKARFKLDSYATI